MGFRKAISIGAILMAAGQFTLFMNNQTTFFIGLALLVVGNGFFKPNISSMIGRLYPDGDKRRDGAFTLFYMGINMGAFLAPLTCGAIGENEGWQYGFLTAGIGMLLGYLIFLWGSKSGIYNEIGIAPDQKPTENIVKSIPNSLLPYLAMAIMAGLSWVLIINNDVVDYILGSLALIIIGYLLYQASKMEIVAKQRIWVVVILLLFTTIFWTFFELAGSALNLFTARNVDKTFFGWEMKTTYFQSINPLFIMLFAPIFSWIWIKLSNINKEPAAPYKFGAGLVLLGLGFLALKLGGNYAVLGMVPAIFIVLLYLLHTIGELTLSPVGLSLVTKLSPKHMVAFMMGIWFLSSSIAHQGGKHIAKLTTVSEETIVKSDAFRTSENIPADFKSVFEDNEIKKMFEKQSVEGIMTSDAFIEKLNAINPEKQYTKSTIVINEVLEEAKNYSGAKREKVEKSATQYFLSLKGSEMNTKVETLNDFAKLTETSPTTSVNNVIKNESLNKGLSVFSLLGFVAIGCGAVIFLMGGFITRWMHGVK